MVLLPCPKLRVARGGKKEDEGEDDANALTSRRGLYEGGGRKGGETKVGSKLQLPLVMMKRALPDLRGGQ